MKDIYTEVTNRIVAALEKGTPPWVCPWRQGSALPNNLATGKAYRGVNVLILAVEAMSRNFTDNRWLTFRGRCPLRSGNAAAAGPDRSDGNGGVRADRRYA